MTAWLVLAAKVLLAGFFVGAISHFSTALKPKLFAGLFAAAPSVAAASLLITAFYKPSTVMPDAQGMIAGACGMIACCLCAMLFVPKLRALFASGAGWLAWAAASLVAYVVSWR